MSIQKINGVNIGKYYTLNGIFSSAVWGPQDNVTYYAGARPALSTTSTNAVSRVYVPQGGTITKSYLFVANDGTLGSGETSTIAIIKNGATGSPTTVSAAVTTNSSANVFSNTALSISVATGDYIEWRWVCPAWVTNPTSVRIWCTALVEV
jgi:hypothetical protein